MARSMLARCAATARVGARVAGTGLTAAMVAGQVRRLERRGPTRRARAGLLRDGSRRALDTLGLRVEVHGGLPPGPVLLACNHLSSVNPLVLAAAAPCVPISKLDLRRWPVFGPIAAGLGVIFHARGEPGSGLRVLREAEAALLDGLPVLNFPEGTTTDGREVLRFHRGLFGLAARLGVPVVPAALRYRPADLAWTGDATFVPHFLRIASRAGSRATLRFGEPLRPAGASASAVAAEVRSHVVALLEAA